jgi:hypothetical protein
MEMREITANVKKTLLRSGFDNNNLCVHRGKGTAAFWVYVSLEISRHPECSCGKPDEYGRRETCQNCKDKWSHINNVVSKIVLAASGRDARHYEQQNILIQLGFKEA